MIIKIKISFLKNCKTFEYDTEFSTAQNFLEEVSLALKRDDIFFMKQSDGQPISLDRLDKMLKAVDDRPIHDIFKDFIFEDEVLCLKVAVNKVEEKSSGVVASGHSGQKPTKMWKIAKKLCPRVCDARMARAMGLPQGAFITKTAQAKLSTPQKGKWEDVQNQIMTEGGGDSYDLSKYYSQSNKQIVEASNIGNFGEGEKTMHFFVAYQEWINGYKEDFLGDEQNSEEEETRDETRRDIDEQLLDDIEDDTSSYDSQVIKTQKLKQQEKQKRRNNQNTSKTNVASSRKTANVGSSSKTTNVGSSSKTANVGSSSKTARTFDSIATGSSKNSSKKRRSK